MYVNLKYCLAQKINVNVNGGNSIILYSEGHSITRLDISLLLKIFWLGNFTLYKISQSKYFSEFKKKLIAFPLKSYCILGPPKILCESIPKEYFLGRLNLQKN